MKLTPAVAHSCACCSRALIFSNSFRRRLGAWRSVLHLLVLIAFSSTGFALTENPVVSFKKAPGGFPIISPQALPTLFVDEMDHAGLVRVARDLQADIERVCGRAPTLDTKRSPQGDLVVIIGTVGKSRWLDALVRAGKFDPKDLSGKWEASIIQVIEEPLPGVRAALVIAGSDKRGTIYGAYTISEQLGVSPWYWWADVPVTKRTQAWIVPGRHASGEPVVKYRGIFLNDEAPALTGWANEKFGGFNHRFYGHVFELILRLRGNYLWPAMWGSAFNDDDPRNPGLADEYGIVMGTSHHEPLMRAHDEWRRYGKGPWNYAENPEVLRDFWRGGVSRVRDFEKIISIGMRGDGDEAMSEETNVALLERIVADQRKIIAEVMQQDPARVPQLWALYKEVQGYYERGMRVPDDVTLLWCDDNWGNIRRLPFPSERGRAGGAGVYYHFDYVGGPRNYKWLNTVPLTKIWEQMHLAWRYDANRIWIVNVGDLKPMEFPIEFFLTYAWDPSKWPYERLQEYSEKWAAREFGTEAASEVAALINGYTKLHSRRKPEMLAPDTFSLTNYREAERVLAEWRNLVARADRLDARLPAEHRAAFFQLVLYPVKASAVIQDLYVAAGLNQLYARQGRSDAGAFAARAREQFATDGALARSYHTLRDGKWNHMMSQVKLGYTYWQQPEIETMPAVSEVRPRSGAAMAVAVENGDQVFPFYGARPLVLPTVHDLSHNSVWLEVFNRGSQPFDFRITSNSACVTLSQTGGTIASTVRVEVGVDWDQAPLGRSEAKLLIERTGGEKVTVTLPIHKWGSEGLPSDFSGHVEIDRHVAIEAPHFSRAIAGSNVAWKVLADFGRTLGGITTFPVEAAADEPSALSSFLEYEVFLTSSGEMTLELHCAPSLDFQSGEGLRFAVSVDEGAPQVLRLNTWETLQTWNKAVGDGVQKVTAQLRFEKPGRHVIKLWRVTPGVVFQRLVLNAGGARPSYLGPPESPRVSRGSR
jgi:hypothetical protein